MADLAEVYGSYIFHPGKIIFDILETYSPTKQKLNYYGNSHCTYEPSRIKPNYLGMVTININDLDSFDYKVYPATETEGDVKRVHVTGNENSFTFPIKNLNVDYFVIVWPTVKTIDISRKELLPVTTDGNQMSDLYHTRKTPESQLLNENSDDTTNIPQNSSPTFSVQTILKETEPIFGIYYTKQQLTNCKKNKQQQKELMKLQDNSEKAWNHYMFMQKQLQKQQCSQEDVDEAKLRYEEQFKHFKQKQLYNTNSDETIKPFKQLPPDSPEDPDILQQRIRDINKQTDQLYNYCYNDESDDSWVNIEENDGEKYIYINTNK